MGYRTTKSKIKEKDHKANSYTDFFYKAFRNILLVSIPLVVILGLVLSSLHSSASTDQIEFSLSVSCTMSSVVNTAHTKEITNGTYHSNVGKTTITALCNDGNGYTVYATGYSNNEVGNNKLINTTNSQYSIDTGLATSGSTSQWAVKLNNLENDPSTTPPVIESAYDDTYGLVPNNWTKVASRPSGTTDMNLGSSFTTTYSIYTSSNQFAGTYRGQVKYALLHPYSNNNTLSFDSFDQAFAFYEKEKVTVTDPITGNTGSYYKMQDMESHICNNISSTGESTATQLVDIRDNKPYWITKLADNHCWMTQNLDLDLVAYINEQGQEIVKPLTSNDTDLTDHSLAGAYADDYNYDPNTSIITWTPERKTIDFQSTTVTDWANDNNNPYSANKTDSAETGHASLGNWYNWTAAIASNNSSSLTQNTINDISKNPQNSICPKGWRLPTISSQSAGDTSPANEFARLNLLYNNNSTSDNAGWLNPPLHFLKPGWIGGPLNLLNTAGFYWSSTHNSGNAYDLAFSTDLNPVDNYSRGYGFSVRCLAR